MTRARRRPAPAGAPRRGPAARAGHRSSWRHVVGEAVDAARVVEPDRPITVALEPATVIGDRDRLRQIVDNLLANVRAHTGPGTPVRGRSQPRRRHAVISVADSGPGLTEEQASHVFERFYRADASRARASGGVGLGLAIVAAVAAGARRRRLRAVGPGRGSDLLDRAAARRERRRRRLSRRSPLLLRVLAGALELHADERLVPDHPRVVAGSDHDRRRPRRSRSTCRPRAQPASGRRRRSPGAPPGSCRCRPPA